MDDAILDKLNVDKHTREFTKPISKEKHFTHFNDTTIMAEDYNFQADLLLLPETDTHYKYLLVCFDIATREVDFEPLKTKNQTRYYKRSLRYSSVQY